MFDKLNLNISYDKIRRKIKQLINATSAGRDLMLNEFLKNVSTD